MAVSNNQIGFECEFLEPPADCLQSECPICLHILREPYQVTCCGKSFCRRCIERVKGSNKPCPCCNKGGFNDFPNLGLQQPLYGFKVYCVSKEKGCDWKGELVKLDNHLNLNPQDRDDNELKGCEFAKIECSYCSNLLFEMNSFTIRMSSVTNALSVVNIAMSTSRRMMMSFTTTGLCVAVTQCSAQISVDLSLSGRSLMIM